MIKFIVAFSIVWCIIALLISCWNFSTRAEKIKAFKKLLFAGFCGILSLGVLFTVVQLF